MMRNYEFTNADAKANLTCIRACLTKAVNDGDGEVTIFSSLCFVKENYNALKQELKREMGNLCSVKSSRPKVFCGYKMPGLEVHFLSDDKDLLKSHILDLFSGQFISETKTFDKQKS